ncbi:MAG: ImmA/IrrE family metallo-endopeptidase [Lachnospiraceae bacterium]|nr:ImmA/IrrE family metallo-endopeptidase [Lachnospiraceae bacterium]
MNIAEIVSRLIKKCKTSNPFELANALGIKILLEELGNIKGYYNKPLRMKQIHINCNLDRQAQLFTCAHELGHAILHPNASTPFLRSSTLLSVDKMEIEANEFATILLIPNEVILENRNLTVEQLSRLVGYEQSLIELRLKSCREM